MSEPINKDYSKKSIVTESFRKMVLNLYPGLSKSIAYRRFFAVLLFSVHRDRDSKDVIIPLSVMADIEDKVDVFLKNNNNYNALPFLKKFQSDVMSPETFSWSGWSKKYEKARTARVVWKNELLAALKEEIPNRKNKNLKRVVFATGESHSAAKRKLEFEERRKEILKIIANTEPAVQPLLSYLNSRSQRLFTEKFYENVDECVKAIETESDTAKIHYNLMVLKSIERIPKPIYSPSKDGKSDRLFTGSWMLLSRDYRKILTKGWDSYDLKFSQLAICASLWKIKTVSDFLISGGDVWQEFFTYLGLDYSLKQTNRQLFNDIKAPLKVALYSTIYGKRVCDVEGVLSESEILIQYCKQPPATFTQHGIITSLIAAREKRKQQIRKVGSIKTCFGRTMKVIYTPPRTNNIKSLMALEAQALELKILLPVLKLAQTTQDFQIVLWAHDGFYVWYKDSDKKATWEPRIIQAVDREVNKLNVFTKLDIN